MEYEGIELPNQRVWDAYPDRADGEVLDAIESGGFSACIDDPRFSGVEGKIMAIQRGLVDLIGSSWVTNEEGWLVLEGASRKRPVFLGAQDMWHNCRFEYLAKDVEVDGMRALQLFKSAYVAKGQVGMQPLLTREDVKQLHNFLGKWLSQ